ncbi:uncharacterized protein LOC128172715 [Crassostrea angulata]|uniref:uncharacterized protein LOC128172715 n=1 Tax=Magallana angulata TaxID=2784310 RepID=UPI0022B218A7|nr:uncharacterized protein LOC128172715 [Crassostrea angulata]
MFSLFTSLKTFFYLYTRKYNNMQDPLSPANKPPADNDFEMEWNLLGEEWSLMSIPNIEGPSHSSFDPYFALDGDDATDIKNLEPSKETQILQKDGHGKPSMLRKLLSPPTSTITAPTPRVTSEKGELREVDTSNQTRRTNKRKFETMAGPMESQTQNKENDFVETFRQKRPQKYAALERRCRSSNTKNERPLLGEELSALQQLIDCMVKDLAQSAILVNYITDFIEKNCKRRVAFKTL